MIGNLSTLRRGQSDFLDRERQRRLARDAETARVRAAQEAEANRLSRWAAQLNEQQAAQDQRQPSSIETFFTSRAAILARQRDDIAREHQGSLANDQSARLIILAAQGKSERSAEPQLSPAARLIIQAHRYAIGEIKELTP